MQKAEDVPWTGSEEDNQRLLDALRVLAREKGTLGRVAQAMAADPIAITTEEKRSGRKYDNRKAMIATSTLERWKDEGLERVTDAQPHKKRLVFEFLERSPEFRTALYRPEAQVPPGLMAFLAANASRVSQPFAKDLSKLDGAFKLYRPAWTTPEQRDRVLVSRLLFTTDGGSTRFREEQDYVDTGFHDARIHEIDEGAVMFTAACIVMFGLGVNAERVKFFVADSWQDALNGPLPVTRLSGTMMGVSGRKHHPGFPFVATRTATPFAEIETGVHPTSSGDLDGQVIKALGLD